MNQVIERRSHEDMFLEEGWYFALAFKDGWFCGRVVSKQWANLQPWSLGAVAAGANLAAYDQVQDPNTNHYFEPWKQELVYQSFWGIAPTQARIKWQNPIRTDLGSMLQVSRSLTDNQGYIDGYKSPFYGPFSPATEVWTVKDRYPAFQVLNPLPDAMSNAMLNVDQRQYSYQIVTDKDMIKALLTGEKRVKKVTMGTADPLPMPMPQWLQSLIGNDLLSYSLSLLSLTAVSAAPAITAPRTGR
jgi:hypothetical protein